MLKSALRGELDLIFVVGADPRADFIDSELANAALDEVDFVVSVDTYMSETSSRADLVLPAAAFAEKSGTTTNFEGRIFTLNQKVTPPGVCRPDWIIASEIALEMGEDLGFGSSSEVLDEIAAVSQLHWGLSWSRLTAAATVEGALVPLSPTALSIKRRAMLDQVSTPGIASVWNQGLAQSKTAYLDVDSADGSIDPAPKAVQGIGLPEPLWPMEAIQPAGSLSLDYIRKLYSRGEHLTRSPHLSELIVKPKCRISYDTAKQLGVKTGESVRIIDTGGGEASFEAEVDDAVKEGAVELIHGSFLVSGFSPVRADKAVNYVKVERA